ncbi:hypothetical protein VIBNISOn1_560076 [Vibrio nigripulchritudo SOn1]|uniref:Uncharacterized protein n=1 Tax=Vibrio nigripulchritudo SOn1 TaxID=1238450 RepID=A0AAV2VV00_9VIBR|nr:hypothetical protein VIBNISOn1_560076 [Vibrio nigripulchritudo SOn1]
MSKAFYMSQDPFYMLYQGQSM